VLVRQGWVLPAAAVCSNEHAWLTSLSGQQRHGFGSRWTTVVELVGHVHVLWDHAARVRGVRLVRRKLEGNVVQRKGIVEFQLHVHSILGSVDLRAALETRSSRVCNRVYEP